MLPGRGLSTGGRSGDPAINRIAQPALHQLAVRELDLERRLERAGVPRSVAMRMVGHKIEAIDRRYAVVNDADCKLAALTAQIRAQ